MAEFLYLKHFVRVDDLANVTADDLAKCKPHRDDQAQLQPMDVPTVRRFGCFGRGLSLPDSRNAVSEGHGFTIGAEHLSAVNYKCLIFTKTYC